MEKDNDLIKKPMKVDYATWTAFFKRREILEQTSLLDNVYFIYTTESNLCYQAILEGNEHIY